MPTLRVSSVLLLAFTAFVDLSLGMADTIDSKGALSARRRAESKTSGSGRPRTIVDNDDDWEVSDDGTFTKSSFHSCINDMAAHF